MIGTILLFLVLLSVLVLAHEWGHFAAARKSGMVVEEFGIGFPPKLFSWTDSKGTSWSVNLIPIGGFVRIQGESGEHRFEVGSFATKSYIARFIVLFGGVFMNLVVAVVLFTFGFAFGLPAVIEGGVDTHAIVTDQAVNIVQVISGSPAEQAGLKEGDKLISIDGADFAKGDAAREALKPHADSSPIEIVVEQSGDLKTVKVVPAYIEEIGHDGVGVALVETGKVRYPIYFAPVKGVTTTVGMTVQIVEAFGGLIKGVFTKDSNVAAQLSGPVGIAVLTGEVAHLGLAHLVQFAAMLSDNLAVLNIMPFPALDGGRIFFLLIEAIRRKPASQALEQGIHAAGFALLILLVVFVTYRDIVNLF
ncbi:MAG: Zinc metalloprotease [Patescibacteria group bacterium]|nr:Zinc metalloprotease [Patescibacteria group bacterium]